MPARILIVDDEPDMVELLSHNLQNSGYEVFTAGNGIEALHQARRHLPDLILLDLMLDGMDGYSVCEILRHQPSTNHTPILLVSALGGELARLNGAEAGADGFVQKPFRSRDLLNRVETVLGTARAKAAALLAAEQPAQSQ